MQTSGTAAKLKNNTTYAFRVHIYFNVLLCVIVLDYISELFETILNMAAEEKEQAMVELQNATPQPLCAEFDKETRKQPVEKRTKRQNMCMQEVPATCLGKFYSYKSIEKTK